MEKMSLEGCVARRIFVAWKRTLNYLKIMNMKSSMTRLIITVLLLVFSLAQMEAQGWRRTFDVDTLIYQEWTRMVFQMNDGGYLLIGDRMIRTDAEGDTLWTKQYPSFQINYYYGNNMVALLPDESIVVAGFTGAAGEAYLSKFDSNGDLIWQKTYDYTASATLAEAVGIAITLDGGFAILINLYGNQQVKQTILKTDSNGNQQWSNSISDTAPRLGRSITSLSDGGFAIAGQKLIAQDWRANVVKLDSQGEVVWDSSYFDLAYTASVIETDDQNLIVYGQKFGTPPTNERAVFIIKLDANGQKIWQTLKEGFWFISPGSLIETTDGQFVACGEIRQNEFIGHGQGFLWKINDHGEETWWRSFDGDYNKYEFFKSVAQTADGGFIIGGSQFDQPQTYFEHLLLKTDALGYDYSHHLLGNLFRDDDLGCDPDPGELGLDGWLITATDGEQTFYGNTDALGNFNILLDTGIYEVSVTPYLYWENCQPSYTVQALQTYDTTALAIPLKPEFLCPYMQVDMAPLLSLTLCGENSYAVSYCNFGTIEAVGATVQVTLADGLNYISATVPLLTQQGQVLTFDIGTVGIGDCGSFRIDFSTGCDPEIFNTTLCSEAHIFPDTICIEGFWLGPNLRIEAGCDADSVVFNIINEGGPMTEPAQYIVIEDNLIMMTSDFQLPEGGQQEVRVGAQDETTYHFVAMQSPGFPGDLGYPVATATAEGCVGNVVPGALLQFPPDDGEPWLDITCSTVWDINYPSVALIANPVGWQSEHFITNNTVIQYRIQFQNTSAGVVQDVVIWDSIPAPLDPATIVVGASSHPVSFELIGQGMAKFTFNDINLPDSISNELGSHGFVEFQIAQIPDNQPGTLIDNGALVQMDLGNPVQTNGVFHTIQVQWLGLINGSVEVFSEKMEVSVSPNPMSDFASFGVKNLPSGENRLVILDATGRVVSRQPFFQDKAVLQRGSLTPGLYFFKIENDGRCLGSGKLVVR
jgi:outer membrane protein assembly factor BamB